MICDNITEIDVNVFSWCSNLETNWSIKIGNSVTKIGTNSFHDRYKLETVTCGKSAETIGGGSFGECNLKTSTPANHDLIII